MKYIKKTVSLIVMAIMAMTFGVSVAQNLNQSNLSHSPYTRYGYGKLGTPGNASTRGMGEVGIAVRSNNYTTLANPASLTAIDTLTMIFSMGVDADYSSFRENGKSESDWDAGLSYMTMHFPLWRNFAMSLSLSPYSMVGYNYGYIEKKPVINAINKHDTLSVSNNYTGVGGINNFMMGMGYRAFQTKMQELNIGFNAGFLFGTIQHGIVLNTSSQSNSTYVTREMSVRGLHLQFGAQYTQRLNATRSITLGATFQPQLNLHVDADETKLSTDTLQVGETYRRSIKSPMKFGVGLSYNVLRQLMVSAEYEMTRWSEVNALQTDFIISDGLFKDVHRLAVGAEFIPKAGSSHFFQNCRYRAGFNTKNSYLSLGDSNLQEYAVSAGFSMPVNRRCFLDFSVGYNRLQPKESKMLKEDYLTLSVGVTFNEMMFFRNRLR